MKQQEKLLSNLIISDQRDMLIYSFRYVLGRQTYAVSTVTDNIIRNWNNLSDGDKNLFKQEIQDHKDQWGFSPIDEPSWDKILLKDN